MNIILNQISAIKSTMNSLGSSQGLPVCKINGGCTESSENKGFFTDEYRLLTDMNFNHPPTNLNPEFKPNVGCGCVGSYNGGAGGGTAECADCCKPPYEAGFKDKKRDPNCCCCEDYLQPLPGKTAAKSGSQKCSGSGGQKMCKPIDETRCCRHPGDFAANVYHSPAKSQQPAVIPCPCDEIYQSGLCNKKPTFSDCSPVCPCVCAPDTYESICNKDAQRYKGKGSERACYFSDDACDTCQPTVNKSNNNSCEPVKQDECKIFWENMRENHYACTCPEVCRPPKPDPCKPDAPVPKRKPKCSLECCLDEICCSNKNFPPIKH